MPYVNIPDSGLGGATAKIVGKLQGEVASKVFKKVNEVVDKLKSEGCPPSGEIDRLRNKVNRLLSLLSSIDGRLAKFRAIPSKLKAPVGGLKAALKIILSLPIPQSVPPGFGLPINITTKYADLMHLLKELIKQAEEIIQSIEVVLETPSSNLKSLDRLLANADSALRGCELEKTLNEQLNDEVITEEELINLGLYSNGRLIVSTLGPKLFSSSNQSQNRGKWTKGFNYKENDIVSLEGIKYICLKDHLSNDNNRPPSSFWTTPDQAAQDSTKSILDSLNKIDNSNLPQSVKDQLKSFLDRFKGQDTSNQKESSEYYYTNINGQQLIISIITDPSSPKIAPRRYAEARNANGGIVMTGPKSFSSDVKVLIDEIKFRIDNQLS